MQRRYAEALNSLKFLLEKAFLGDSARLELHCYERMCLCWYYLGNLEKAKYYQQKRQKGYTEAPNAEIRIVYQNLRANYNIVRYKDLELTGYPSVFDSLYEAVSDYYLVEQRRLATAHLRENTKQAPVAKAAKAPVSMLSRWF